jgi:hypothetical protein
LPGSIIDDLQTVRCLGLTQGALECRENEPDEIESRRDGWNTGEIFQPSLRDYADWIYAHPGLRIG